MRQRGHASNFKVVIVLDVVGVKVSGRVCLGGSSADLDRRV